MLNGFSIGFAGMFLLLSLQFKNYREPLIVMVAVPLVLIGVIWRHILIGLAITIPSIVGFASFSEIAVSDSPHSW